MVSISASSETWVAEIPLMENCSPPGFGEMEKTADVIVLVVTGEETFGFLSGEAKVGERDWLTEVLGVGAV